MFCALSTPHLTILRLHEIPKEIDSLDHYFPFPFAVVMSQRELILPSSNTISESDDPRLDWNKSSVKNVERIATTVAWKTEYTISDRRCPCRQMRWGKEYTNGINVAE
jgi:hypothetical protein